MELFKKTIATLLILAFVFPQVAGALSFSNATLNYSGLRLDFDGVDERGKSGNDPTGNTNTSGTVSCWVNFDTVHSANGAFVIFGMGGDDTDQATNFGRVFINLRYISASSIFNRIEMFHAADGSGTANRVIGDTVISAGTQYHIVVSSSGTAWKIYVNGTLQTLTVQAGSNNGDWFGDIGTVGTRHYTVGDLWRDGTWSGSLVDGKIDGCATWSSQLSDADVTQLYNGGKPIHPCALGLCTNLENLWRLGDDVGFGGTVTTMHDSIGSASVDNFTMENMESADIVRTSYY